MTRFTTLNAPFLPNIHWDEEIEQIEVTSYSPQVDPDWRHVDAAGHGHFHGVHRTNPYPTLKYVVDEEDYFDEDGEDYPGSGHYECPECGEHIVPGTKPASLMPQYIPGQRTMTLRLTKPGETATYSGFSMDEVAEIRKRIAFVIGDTLAPYRTETEYHS